MEDLISKLLSLSDVQFETLIATVGAARRVVGPPKNLGRPRGSKNAPKSDQAPQPPLINSPEES